MGYNERGNNPNYGKKGEDSSGWKGGKTLIEGYVYIYAPDHPNSTNHGYVAEHRLIMERHLGRLLTKQERVHHIDGNKRNNAFSNLLLFDSIGSHMEHEMSIARELKIGPKYYPRVKCEDMSNPRRRSDGYIDEHVLIIEKELGRYLTKGEEVHHINGNKADNSVENLLLFSSKSEHAKYRMNTIKYIKEGVVNG